MKPLEYSSQSGVLPPELKKLSPASSTTSGAQRWQVGYDELKFEKKLGNGAYGEVYEGRYKKGKVAIKVYDFRGELTKDQQAEIIKEADLMESLRSEYLVGFRGICFDQRYCLVMEYCEGGTLRARLNQKERDISLWEQLLWAKGISYGLYHLHSVRIVHRDLKGDNILLDKHGDAKLADFGLSVVKSSSASHSKKGGSHGIAGTLPWMAPELHDGASNTLATDVYSLGVTLWEIVSRKLPFAGLTAGQMISKTMTGKRDPLPDDCPKIFHLMIQACLNGDPTQRPTAEKVGDEFEAALQSLTSVPELVGAPSSEPASPLSAKEKKPESGRVAAMASEQALEARFGSPSTPVQVAKTPTEDELLQLRDEVAALKLKQAQEELRRQDMEKKEEEIAHLRAELDRRKESERQAEIQRQEAEKKKTPPPVEPKKLSEYIYTILPAPKPAAKPIDEKALSQLLKYVAEGEQDKAEALIKEKLGKGENLLLAAGTVTDLSGREFKQITAFQYALWALDWHMWKMIQNYLPTEAQAEQLNALESKGTAHGKHFSLKLLTDELKTYVDNYASWSGSQCSEHWNKKVGGAQKGLPAHVVNEYCRGDRPFDPCPSEWESKLPRTREIEVLDSTQSKYIKGSWFVSHSSKDTLGLNFAVSRAWWPARRGWLPGGRGGPWWDLKALQSLWKTRTEQLELLKSDLLSAASHSQRLG